MDFIQLVKEKKNSEVPLMLLLIKPLRAYSYYSITSHIFTVYLPIFVQMVYFKIHFCFTFMIQTIYLSRLE